MSKDLRIGIVGCGKISTVEHGPALSRLPGVRLVAFCDLVESKRQHFRDTFAPDAALFDNFEDFLNAELDAVVIATPNYLHCPMALAALKTRRHVLCEKPMAGILADAKRIVSAARKARRIVHVNQSFHYLPTYATVADLVQKGRIGKPLHVRCIRAGGATPDVAWSPGATWFMSKEAQGGLIFDIGVHMADLMQWCAGPIDSITSILETRTENVDVPDHAVALFRFANGATGVLELSWTMPFGADLFEIYGTLGRIRIGFTEKPIELITKENGAQTKSYPENLSGIPSSHQSFVDAILGKHPTHTPAELGRDAVALCEAISKSGETGKSARVWRPGKRG
ncbi:MAG: Gfo/Idh/MocA family oxidoreductase [Verrucomicrobia bacterium]|nr:Gfo/Idh/MocA family oxidoreductase [Verrucomicrobiota bacterium]